MSSTTAKIATVQPGFCDACEGPFMADDGDLLREDTHEFVFASRGGSFLLQYATCGQCHQMREPGAVSAPPVRVLVGGTARVWKEGVMLNNAPMRCTDSMGDFLSRVVIEVRFSNEPVQFPSEVAA